MEARETTFRNLVEGTNQYVVPLFQRPYSWERRRWRQLWDDLIGVMEMPSGRQHFLGSVVTMPLRSAPEAVNQFLLIDGQQRLTTLLVLLAAVRDQAAAGPETSTLAAEIEATLLTNPYKRGLDRLKLLPTQRDRAAMEAILCPGRATAGAAAVAHPPGPLADAYVEFARLFARSGLGAAAVKAAVERRLSLVSIHLGADDNPHLIFESLNAKGQRLTEADLIRNFVLMRFPQDRQEAIYTRYWRPVQEAVGDDPTEFVRHHLSRGGTPIRKGEVYVTLKERTGHYDETALATWLDDLTRHAGHYARLLDPQSREPDNALRGRLMRLNRLEVTVAYPFLLDAYDDLSRGELTTGQLADVLDDVEDFVIRRYVCGVPRNDMNKMFPLLHGQARRRGGSFQDGVRRELAARRYPRDEEFVEKLTTTPLYGQASRNERAKLILERLEESFGHRERVATGRLQVEHVMPQTLTAEWRSHLDPEHAQAHEELLHTLGNLTLTAYNQPMSNAPFEDKRRVLADSHLDLNRAVAREERWDAPAIRRRAETLAARALEVWPDLSAGASNGRAPRTVPRRLTILAASQDVATWREVSRLTLAAIQQNRPEAIAELVVRWPNQVSADPSRLRDPVAFAEQLFFDQHRSGAAHRLLCERAVAAAGWSAGDWRVELV